MDRNSNLDRLKAVMAVFGLTVSQVAKASGVSRPYVSRALSESLTPSTAFWRVLEASLGKLVEERHGQVFSVPVTQADEIIRQALESKKAA